MATRRKKGRKGGKKKGRKKAKRRSTVKQTRGRVNVRDIFTRRINKKHLPVLTKCLKNGRVNGRGKRLFHVVPMDQTSHEYAREVAAIQKREAAKRERHGMQVARMAARGHSGWEGIARAAAARQAALGSV